VLQQHYQTRVEEIFEALDWMRDFAELRDRLRLRPELILRSMESALPVCFGVNRGTMLPMLIAIEILQCACF